MLKLSLGAGPGFSAHYEMELLTDDLSSLTRVKFVHMLSQAAGPSSWPHVRAKELTEPVTRVKMSGSLIRSDANAIKPLLPLPPWRATHSCSEPCWLIPAPSSWTSNQPGINLPLILKGGYVVDVAG